MLKLSSFSHRPTERVLLYVLPSIAYGGAELQSIQQINWLYKQGHNIYLLVLEEVEEELAKTIQLPAEHIRVLHFPFSTLRLKAIQKSLTLIAPICKLIQQHHISHVIAHLPLAQFVLRCAKIAYLFWYRQSFQLIPYHHSIQYEANPLNTWGKKMFNLVHAGLARLVDSQNICVSAACLQNLQEHFFVRQPHVVFNSIPPKTINDTLAQQYFKDQHLAIRPFMILIPGRLHPSKGHLFFLKGLEKIVQELSWTSTDVLVIIAGGGDLEGEIRQAIRDSMVLEEAMFHLTGYVLNDLLLSLYKIVQLTVIPSIHEGFGIVAAEALMQGSVVLCSDAGGLPEIIEHKKNGFVFERLQQKKMVNQLRFIYQNRAKQLIDPQTLVADYQKRFTLAAQMENVLLIMNE